MSVSSEWVVPAIIFLIMGAGAVGVGRASGWQAHIENNPRGDITGYVLGIFLWIVSVVNAAYLGAFFVAQ